MQGCTVGHPSCRAAVHFSRKHCKCASRGVCITREFALQLEYCKEREAVDAIMRRIEAEDALDAHARAAKRAETQAFIATFLAQQQRIRCAAGAHPISY
jgi:hypothetical protein